MPLGLHTKTATKAFKVCMTIVIVGGFVVTLILLVLLINNTAEIGQELKILNKKIKG
jgi:uncharacterized integral membrane protein